jgi:ribosome-associated toxin RatA of RatAB toxin-antitoxin module
MRQLFLLFVLWMPALYAQDQSAAPVVQAGVDRISMSGESFFDVQAIGFARATPQQVWRVLTDYERLPEFVPDLVSSKVVSRTPQEILLEQHSKAGFLFVSHSIHMLVRVEERPFSAVDVALVSGDMRRYSGRWTMEAYTQNGVAGTRIGFHGTMEPDFFVPPLISKPIVLANVRRMVAAVVAEIERRSGD